jgi:hypothetical protein
MLIGSSALAEQRCEPPVSIERLVEAFVVNADGGYRETLEMGIRIETPEGVSNFGTKRIAIVSPDVVYES